METTMTGVSAWCAGGGHVFVWARWPEAIPEGWRCECGWVTYNRTAPLAGVKLHMVAAGMATALDKHGRQLCMSQVMATLVQPSKPVYLGTDDWRCSHGPCIAIRAQLAVYDALVRPQGPAPEAGGGSDSE